MFDIPSMNHSPHVDRLPEKSVRKTCSSPGRPAGEGEGGLRINGDLSAANIFSLNFKEF